MRSQEIITAIIAVTVKMGGFTFSQDKHEQRKVAVRGLGEQRGCPARPLEPPQYEGGLDVFL